MDFKIKTSILVLSIFTLVFSTGISEASPEKEGLRRTGYAIQMGAFSDLKNAERFAEALQKKGIEAFYYRKDNGVYAVRFGDFSTKSKATVAAKKLVSEHLIGNYYIAPPSEVVFAKKPTASKNPPAVETKSEPKTKPKTATGKATKHDSKDMGSIAAQTAERFVGIPYRWGGDTVVDGMDCSGFTRAVYSLCGLNIPRTSREQYKAGVHVDKEDIKDGDLLFFGAAEDKISHVGIYIGNGKFVHAPRRGEDIKISTVDESYFNRRFVGARRYFQ